MAVQNHTVRHELLALRYYKYDEQTQSALLYKGGRPALSIVPVTILRVRAKFSYKHIQMFVMKKMLILESVLLN